MEFIFVATTGKSKVLIKFIQEIEKIRTKELSIGAHIKKTEKPKWMSSYQSYKYSSLNLWGPNPARAPYFGT